MKNIIAAVVAVVCIVVGGIAGNFLKSGSGGSSKPASGGHEAAASHESGGESGHGEKDSGHEKKEKKKKEASSHGGGGGHGDGGGGASSGDVTYFKFSREFVIPLMGEDRVESLVILNINLEVDSNISGKLFSMEPKVRDNINTTLIELSSHGDTMRTLGNVESYETMRTMILMNLKNVLPEGVENVLIVDMGKQDL